MMWANYAVQRFHVGAGYDGTFIAVIFQIDESRVEGKPRRDQLRNQSNSGGGEHAIRPHHLRSAAGGSVIVCFATDALIIDKATTPQAGVARLGAHRRCVTTSGRAP